MAEIMNPAGPAFREIFVEVYRYLHWRPWFDTPWGPAEWKCAQLVSQFLDLCLEYNGVPAPAWAFVPWASLTFWQRVSQRPVTVVPADAHPPRMLRGMELHEALTFARAKLTDAAADLAAASR